MNNMVNIYCIELSKTKMPGYILRHNTNPVFKNGTEHANYFLFNVNAIIRIEQRDEKYGRVLGLLLQRLTVMGFTHLMFKK